MASTLAAVMKIILKILFIQQILIKIVCSILLKEIKKQACFKKCSEIKLSSYALCRESCPKTINTRLPVSNPIM
jgi:hypothetical protein